MIEPGCVLARFNWAEQLAAKHAPGNTADGFLGEGWATVEGASGQNYLSLPGCLDSKVIQHQVLEVF